MAVLHPARVREFAETLGRLAKTDAVDAAVLAEFAEEARPLARPRPDAATRHSQARIGLRRDPIEPRTTTGHRVNAATDRYVLRSLHATERVLKRELDRGEKERDAAVDASPTWQAKAELLESIPGVGEVLSQTLLADLPELGTRSREEIASLVGVAPMNRDSGRQRGHRRVQGGRSEVRRVLHMAALSARTNNATRKVFADRLAAAGTAGTVVIIAVARKRWVIANAVLRDNRRWQPEMA